MGGQDFIRGVLKIKRVHCFLPRVLKSQVWTQKTLKAARFLKKNECIWGCFSPPLRFQVHSHGQVSSTSLPHAGLESCLKGVTRAEAAIPPNLWTAVMLVDAEVPEWNPPPHCHRLPCPDSLPDSKSET